MNIAMLEEKLLDKYVDRYVVAKAVGKRAVQIRQNELIFQMNKKRHKNIIEATVELAEGKAKIIW
ncbi:MAG: hypothetical protein IEMM0003_0142 [bacterium]|nr:MAG: hypothetical protein IEMM0003_0142 [bacterium]